jgi:hypothetical protein
VRGAKEIPLMPEILLKMIFPELFSAPLLGGSRIRHRFFHLKETVLAGIEY